MTVLLRFVVMCALVLAAADAARADILHLMNGGAVEGKVTRIEGGFRVETKAGASIIRDDQVRYHEKKDTPEEAYEKKAAAASPDDFDAQIELGLWCRRNNLPDQAQWHLMLAVALRPDDARARREAGFVCHGKQWLTREESLRRKGLEEYKGKWMPAGEAIKLRMEDEREQEYRETYDAAWKILRDAARESEGRDLAPRVESLLELGRFVVDPLRRASRDGSYRVRKLVLLVCGRMKGQDSLKILTTRISQERDPRLVPTIYEQFAIRQDRTDVLSSLLDMTVNHKAGGVRKRCRRALERMGDKRAIDALVPLAAHKVDPGAAYRDKKPDNVKVEGEEVQVGRPKVIKDPYYPAHEALVALTGELLPPDVEAWSNWWQHRRAAFRFASQAGIQTDEADDPGDSESDTSLESEDDDL